MSLLLNKTSDGTYTLFDDKYKETMHSSSGAYEEAILKHINPSLLLSDYKPSISVLDIGFGLGYNILALLSELGKLEYAGSVTVHSFEVDNNYHPYMNKIIFNDYRDPYYALIKKAYETGSCFYDKTAIYIHFGDARQTIGDVSNTTHDAVFHDPYSPSKNPELWTKQLFLKLVSIMKNEAYLTTYSSAPQIRGALHDAGFFIGRGPSVGKKREGTLARKSPFSEMLGEYELRQLLNDYHSTPYNDCTMNDPREVIIERRLNEMRCKRQSMSSSSSNTDLSL